MIKHETKAEYFARLGRQIEAARGTAIYSEAELGPRSPTIEAIYNKQKIVKSSKPVLRVVPLKRENIKSYAGAKALDELRQQQRRLMDYNVKHYTQRQSRTTLK